MTPEKKIQLLKDLLEIQIPIVPENTLVIDTQLFTTPFSAQQIQEITNQILTLTKHL